MKNIRALIVATLVLGAAAAPAAYAVDVTTYGVGLSSCRAYLDANDGNAADQVAFIDWLAGYFSGVNKTSNHRNNLLGLSDLRAALDSLEGYCRARPRALFAEAAATLVLGAKPGPAAHSLEVTTYGSADKHCQAYLEGRQQAEVAYWTEFTTWLGGYVSGVNTMSLSTNNVLGNAELADAIRWLDGYCGAHRLTPFGAAVEALVAAKSTQQTADVLPKEERPASFTASRAVSAQENR